MHFHSGLVKFLALVLRRPFAAMAEVKRTGLLFR